MKRGKRENKKEQKEKEKKGNSPQQLVTLHIGKRKKPPLHFQPRRTEQNEKRNNGGNRKSATNLITPAPV